jgi:1-aminocyclopropane-1-carboxylate deaminase/D-cysteine desulfhydrase-like pyridoxal-dependent ACC family enzyme
MNQVAIDSIAPPRLDLARTPTPLELLAHTSREMGVDIYVKRDDYTGMELSGNKIRKLEFIMADALASDADTIITCGGAQSNHARATAIAAAKLGLDCRLILRTADPSAPPAPDGNILLNCMAGAQIVWITPETGTGKTSSNEKKHSCASRAAIRTVSRKGPPTPWAPGATSGPWRNWPGTSPSSQKD